MFKQLFANIKGAFFDSRKKLPETKNQKLLMLMGAIYVEENNQLADIEEIYEDRFAEQPDIKKWDRDAETEFKDSLIEEICPLDMQMWGDKFERNAKALLAEAWGIKNKEDAQAKLAWLRTYGHRKYFQALLEYEQQSNDFSLQSVQAFIKQYNSANENSLEFPPDYDQETIRTVIQDQVSYAKEIKAVLPAHDILAWDMARYVHVIRLCFIAQYLTDAECWEELDKITPLCFGKFTDWSIFARSFFAGRLFWDCEDYGNDSLFQASQRLLQHKMSPWKHFPW